MEQFEQASDEDKDKVDKHLVAQDCRYLCYDNCWLFFSSALPLFWY